MTGATATFPVARQRPVAACGLAFVFGAACGLACYFASGASLGLLLGGVAFVAIFTPYLRPIAAVLFTLGIAAIWLFAPITLRQYIRCTLVLVAFAFSIAGLNQLFTRLFRSAVAGASITIVLALLWLTWPIWLAHSLPGRDDLVAWLVFAHPIFAINGVVPELGVWTHQPLMYHLTNLAQDVTYALPRSVAPCATLHALVGVTLLLACLPARGQAAASPS